MEITAAIVAVAAIAAAVIFFRKWQAAEALSSQAQKQLAAMEREIQLRTEQLPLEFGNLAAKVLEDSSRRLSETSEKNLGQLLNPLKERLSEFQKKVEETYHHESRERHSLKAEIGNIIAAHEKMRVETASLTNALKGSSKVQGNWGEHVLGLLLESSGLREGTEFITQGRDMKLAGADGRLQPDVVIKLPDSKHLIIDSKVSLTHYEQVVNAGDDALREQALALFLASVRSHVRGLAEKNYAAAEGLGTPDFVLMFLPIEGAHALALQSDGGLFPFAWDRKVAIVSPTTLMPILKTVASLWNIDRQNKNTAEIARQGGALYDKFVGFVESMEEIGRRLKQTEASYDTAMKRLSTGTGNLVTGAEKLRKLGAKASKALPETMIEEEAKWLEEVS